LTERHGVGCSDDLDAMYRVCQWLRLPPEHIVQAGVAMTDDSIKANSNEGWNKTMDVKIWDQIAMRSLPEIYFPEMSRLDVDHVMAWWTDGARKQLLGGCDV
jgi:hypothetical protein